MPRQPVGGMGNMMDPPGGQRDEMFLQMMIPHHRLAIDMARKALDRADHPECAHGFATLKRGPDRIQVNIQTSGLPAGAYMVWWVVFDTPDGCVDGCGDDDLLNEDANASVFWARGGVVGEGAAANFHARHRVGDDLGEPDSQHLLGDGSLDPSRAEIINVIKYHGPASHDHATLREQTETVLGGCLAGANAVDSGEPFGVQCFDPQAAVHTPQ